MAIKGRIRVLIATLISAVVVGGVAMPSRAVCAAPAIFVGKDPRTAVEYPEVESGSEVTISGFAWMRGCDDTEESGCGSEDPEPYQDIVVRLRGPVSPTHPNEANSIVLGEVDATDEGDFRLTTTLPTLKPGDYYIIAEPAPRFLVRVVKPRLNN